VVVVSADRRGVVGRAGTRLPADLADVTGLTGSFGDALASMRRRPSGHDPGRVALERLRGARAAARELTSAQRADARGGVPVTQAGGVAVPGLALDIDASIVGLARNDGWPRLRARRSAAGACGGSLGGMCRHSEPVIAPAIDEASVVC
jgi:hypothetical protein